MVNAWLVYRRECELLQKKPMTLVDFKTEIVLAHIQSGSKKKRGRPFSNSVTLKKLKRKAEIVRPVDTVWLDQCDH